MDLLHDSQALFAQLASSPGTPNGQSVKTLIENHDAWTHAPAIQSLSAITRLAPRDAATQARINCQRQALSPLLTTLPRRYATAV